LGGQDAHLLGCPGLYPRLQAGFQNALQRLLRLYTFTVGESSDLFARMLLGTSQLFLILSPDYLTSQLRRRVATRLLHALGQASASTLQVIILSWSGLIWLYHVESSSPTYISTATQVDLCRDIVQALSIPCSLQHASFLSTPGILSTPSLLRILSTDHFWPCDLLLPLQRRLAWLVHLLPESCLLQPLTYSVYIPPRCWPTPRLFDTRVLVCLPGECLAITTHPGRGSACLLCSCNTHPAFWWHSLRVFPEATLLISADFPHAACF
jgi:hypothetical protein